MPIKRIIWTLLITSLIALSAAVTQAQSTGRGPWGRGNSVNNPVPAVPDQTTDRVPDAEPETADQESQAAEQGRLHGIHERQQKKTAIVGSWLGTLADGNRIIASYNSDGTVHSSSQGEVSTIPEFGGVLTPTHGVWEHLGGRQFGVTTIGIFYDINTGHLNGFLKVRVLLELNKARDQMSGTDKVQILDPNGNVVVTFPPGTTHYTRIKFEPFN